MDYIKLDRLIDRLIDTGDRILAGLDRMFAILGRIALWIVAIIFFLGPWVIYAFDNTFWLWIIFAVLMDTLVVILAWDVIARFFHNRRMNIRRKAVAQAAAQRNRELLQQREDDDA